MNEIIVIQPESLEHLGNAVRALDNTEEDMLLIDAINSIETTNNDVNSQQKIIEDITTIVSNKAAVETTTQESTSTANVPSTKVQENNSKLLKLLELAEALPEYSSAVSLTGINDWSYFSHNNSRNNLVNLIKPDDTTTATNFEHMLEGSDQLENIPNIKTPNGVNFDFAFTGCSNLNALPQNLDLTNAETADSVFRDCTSITTAPAMNTSKLTSHRRMFRGCTNLASAPQVDTSNSESLEDFLRGCSSIPEIPSYDTSKCKVFDGAFMDCSSITKVPQINTNSAEDFQYMFCGCTNLRYSNTLYNSDNVTNFNYMFAETKACGDSMPVILSSTTNGEKFQYMFQNSSITMMPEIDTSNGKRFSYMYDGCTNMQMPNLHEKPVNLLNAEECQNLFSRAKINNTHGLCPAINMTSKCKNAQAMFASSGIVKLDSLGDTSGVENFFQAFANCNELTSIGKYTPLNLSSCINATNMFYDCEKLTDLNITGSIKTDLDLRWSPLTKYSTKNVITALNDYSNTTEQFTKQVVLDQNLYRLNNLTLLGCELDYLFPSTSTDYIKIHCADSKYTDPTDPNYIGDLNADLINMGSTISGDYKIYPESSAYGNVVLVAPKARYKIPFTVDKTQTYIFVISNFSTTDKNTNPSWSHGSQICIDGNTFNLNEDDIETVKHGINYYSGILLTLEAGDHLIELVGERAVGLTALFKDIYIRYWEPVHSYTYKCCLEHNGNWISGEKAIIQKGWNM